VIVNRDFSGASWRKRSPVSYSLKTKSLIPCLLPKSDNGTLQEQVGGKGGLVAENKKLAEKESVGQKESLKTKSLIPCLLPKSDNGTLQQEQSLNTNSEVCDSVLREECLIVVVDCIICIVAGTKWNHGTFCPFLFSPVSICRLHSPG
jgi:hypothetical protein